MPRDETITELVAAYREAAVGTGSNDPKQNSKNADELAVCYKALRKTEVGRAGIIGLISDNDPHVRGWAAAHSLQWVPEIARPALEALRDNDGPGAFAAKWTLKEFDAGSLAFDY